MKFFRAILVLGVFVAAGCTETTEGPTTSEFNEKRKALESKVAEKRGKAVAEGKIARPTQTRKKGGGQEASGSNFGAVEKGYAYTSTGKRDPFRNFKWERPDRIRDTEVSGPLEKFDLSQLSLVAVVWKTGNARALIQDPSGESYIVAEGARLGKNEGTVITIEDSLVRVKETYVDFLGRETTKDIELRMRRNEGG